MFKHVNCQPQKLIRDTCCPCAGTNLITWVGIAVVYLEITDSTSELTHGIFSTSWYVSKPDEHLRYAPGSKTNFHCAMGKPVRFPETNRRIYAVREQWVETEHRSCGIQLTYRIPRRLTQFTCSTRSYGLHRPHVRYVRYVHVRDMYVQALVVPLYRDVREALLSCFGRVWRTEKEHALATHTHPCTHTPVHKSTCTHPEVFKNFLCRHRATWITHDGHSKKIRVACKNVVF